MSPATKADAAKRQHKRKTGRKARVTFLDVGWKEEDGEWEQNSPMWTVITSVRNGAYQSTGCALAGISHTTLSRYKSEAWELSFDEDGERLSYDQMETPRERQLYKLWEQLGRTEAVMEQEMIMSIYNEGKVDHRAAQAFLSARFPDRWNPKVRGEVNDGPAIAVVTAGELAQQIRKDPGALKAAHDLLEQIAPRQLAPGRTVIDVAGSETPPAE